MKPTPSQTKAQVPSPKNIQGILDLLITLHIHKAYGPNNIPPRLLKESSIITSLVTELFKKNTAKYHHTGD